MKSQQHIESKELRREEAQRGKKSRIEHARQRVKAAKETLRHALADNVDEYFKSQRC